VLDAFTTQDSMSHWHTWYHNHKAEIGVEGCIHYAEPIPLSTCGHSTTTSNDAMLTTVAYSGKYNNIGKKGALPFPCRVQIEQKAP